MKTDSVANHYYSDSRSLVDAIVNKLKNAGKDPKTLKTTDLTALDEFHIRGRPATLQLAEKMKLAEDSRVLDIGSGLGGPARAIAEAYGCHVTGVDLTQAFCDAARAMSDWVGLGHRVDFQQGDATSLPFADHEFDAAITIHAAMNIPDKNRIYEEARRLIKPGGIFAIYDVLQGESGEVVYPVPWARDASISHLATNEEMESLLDTAGFQVLEVLDSTGESERWFEEMMARMAESGPPLLNFQLVLGDDFPEMARSQVRNLKERRIRTVSYICEA